MKIITRFSPTVNGKLHLGHAMTLLINEYFAHSRGGEFFVRFDDDISYGLSNDEITSLETSQMIDIKWLVGGRVDKWISQKSIFSSIRKKLIDLEYEFMDEVPLGHHKLPYFPRMGTSWIPYPYVVNQIAERVVMDNMDGVTHLIRGDDFSTEYSLYCYFCQKFGFDAPEFIFLPRLSSLRGDISKTNGGYKVEDFRNGGKTPEQLDYMLREASLYYPNNGWEIYNIKPNPKIDL